MKRRMWPEGPSLGAERAAGTRGRTNRHRDPSPCEESSCPQSADQKGSWGQSPALAQASAALSRPLAAHPARLRRAGPHSPDPDADFPKNWALESLFCTSVFGLYSPCGDLGGDRAPGHTRGISLGGSQASSVTAPPWGCPDRRPAHFHPTVSRPLAGVPRPTVPDSSLQAWGGGRGLGGARSG